jgi:hypothetical protein
MDAGLSSSGNHHIGIAAGNESGCVTDGMGTGCARCCRGMIRAHESVFHGDVSSSKINQELRHK